MAKLIGAFVTYVSCLKTGVYRHDEFAFARLKYGIFVSFCLGWIYKIPQGQYCIWPVLNELNYKEQPVEWVVTFQQILNQRETKWSVVTSAAAGWLNDLPVQYSYTQCVTKKKLFYFVHLHVSKLFVCMPCRHIRKCGSSSLIPNLCIDGG